MTAETGFSRTAKIFHWSMAAIIIVAWLIGFYAAHLRGDVPRGGTSLNLHKGLASTVIFIVVARVIYRLTHRYPKPLATTPPAAALAAKIVHILLIAIAMIAAPLTGWFWSSVAGHPVTLLGVVVLPPLVPKNPDLYDTAMWGHRYVVWFAGALIAGHILAALKHHFLDRDTVLRRMLPDRGREEPHE